MKYEEALKEARRGKIIYRDNTLFKGTVGWKRSTVFLFGVTPKFVGFWADAFTPKVMVMYRGQILEDGDELPLSTDDFNADDWAVWENKEA